jgi:hypothetical protein
MNRKTAKDTAVTLKHVNPTKAVTTVPIAPPRKIAIWFEAEQEFDLLPFTFFVASANAAQQSFQFFFPDPPEELTYKSAKRRLDSGKQIFKEAYDVYVFVTASYLDGNLFFKEYGPLVQITTYGWQGNFSPPSVFEYLFHSMMCGTLYALCNDMHSHHEFTMGCQFEYTRVKEMDRVDIALGFICRDHREILRSQLGEAVLADVESLFKFTWLGVADEHGSVAYKMKDLFNYDLRKDSGYKKNFFERAQANIDTIWFDMAKELFKGLVLIVVAYLLFRFGLKP